jgi:hypothetical protein
MRSPEGEAVAVDVNIAPLIRALWARGVETVGSCEDGGTSPERCTPPGAAWIAFVDWHDARRFARTCRNWCTYDSNVLLFRPNAAELARAESEGIRFGAMVVFPSTKIAELCTAIEQR